MANKQKISIKMNDGDCQAWVVTPSKSGERRSWPAVIFYMDAFGLRPAMIQMAEHIANQGYVVLLPDLFFRYGPYGPLDPKEVFKGDFRAIVGPMMASTNNLRAAEDTAAFIAYLDSRDDVGGAGASAGKKIATVGFCMGGGMAIAAAGFYPDRIAAAASFHGGNLMTDQPTSPHLLVPKIRAEVYVAGADKDHNYPLEMAQSFEAELTKAGVVHRCEIYAGKSHGWMKPDMPVFDAEGAERGWKEFFALLRRKVPVDF